MINSRRSSKSFELSDKEISRLLVDNRISQWLTSVISSVRGQI